MEEDEILLWARRLCTNYNPERSVELLKEFIEEYERLTFGHE